MSGPPTRPAIGLQLARTARVVTQAFEHAMAAAGGSAAAWQVLLVVRSEKWGNQARLAEALGITGATLTHHLNALEAKGYVRRWREPHNRRVQRTALTAAGEELFEQLRQVATRHDARLRSKLTAKETALRAEKLMVGPSTTLKAPQPASSRPRWVRDGGASSRRCHARTVRAIAAATNIR